MTSHRWRGRIVRWSTAIVGLVTLLVVLPMPGFEFVSVASASTLELPRLHVSDGSELAAVDSHVDSGNTEDRTAAGLAANRVKGTDSFVEPFSMIGVSLAQEPDTPVLVRVRTTGAEWSEWRELEVAVDEGPDLGGSGPNHADANSADISTEPLWVDSASAYEVSLGSADSDGAKILVVREGIKRVATDATPLAGADVPAIAGMHTRSQWGARAPKATPSLAPSVKLAVVHHSDGSNSYSASQVPGIIRGVQAYHMDGRGWDDIGYNFVVDKYGGIWEGRAGGVTNAVIGAHAGGFNTGSVGVMVMGDYTSAQPTSASLEAVSHVIGWKFAQYNVNPTTRVSYTSSGSTRYAKGVVVNLPRVVGHIDVSATACPGTIKARLSTVISRSVDYKNWYTALSTPVGDLESATGGVGSVSVSGWAVDPAGSGAASVRVWAGSQAKTFYTYLSRPDISAAHGGDGKAGFSGVVSGVEPGMQKVCATVWSSISSANNRRLGCIWALVGDPSGNSPVGRFSSIATTPGQVHVKGWVTDPGVASPTSVELTVDGVTKSAAVAGLYFNSDKGNHGFALSAVGITAGTHDVCVKARNQGAGVDTVVDCRVFAVAAHRPGGTFRSAGSNRSRKLDVSGWAIDLETTSPIKVRIIVGSRRYDVLANVNLADVGRAYPGYGPGHGFAASVTADPGPQRVCVHALNVGGGSNRQLGCTTVNIVK